MSVTEIITSIFMGAHVWLTYAALAFVVFAIGVGVYRVLRENRK